MNTFIKHFTEERLHLCVNKANAYAEENNLEIVSTSLTTGSLFQNLVVVFRKHLVIGVDGITSRGFMNNDH